MPLHTKLTKKLGISHPILLAPMGTASGERWQRRSAKRAALGIIGFGYGNQERIDQEFRAAGNARVGCGFITWSLARQPHLLARALDHKPVAVMLSFGDARPVAAAIKDAGAALISQVQTVAQAMEAVDIGTDIIVAQGTEAGGHGATRSTLALVPAVVDAVRKRNDEIVVVAAGGIKADIPSPEQLVAVRTPLTPFQDPDGCETMRCVVLTPGGDYETPGVHHAGRRRGNRVAYGGARAASWQGPPHRIFRLSDTRRVGSSRRVTPNGAPRIRLC